MTRNMPKAVLMSFRFLTPQKTGIRGQQMKEETSKLLVKLLIWLTQFQLGCGHAKEHSYLS